MKSFKQFREDSGREKKSKVKFKNKKSGNVEVMPEIPDSQKGMTTKPTNEAKNYEGPLYAPWSDVVKGRGLDPITERAKSKSQQRFFGMVRATQKGDMGKASSQVQRAASSMKKKDVKDFASTKHKGLPEKKVAKEEHSPNHCGKGEYFCNDRKKCMPIPKGMKVRSDGFLTKESFESGVLKARRHHRVGKLMSFKEFMKIMSDILGEWEK